MLLLLAGLLAMAPAMAEGALRGEWRPTGAADDAWQPFDPARLTRIARNPDGAQIRLWTLPSPAADRHPPSAEPLVLAVRSGALERVRWLPADGSSPVEARLLDVARRGWLGQGRIGFELGSVPVDGAPLQLEMLAQPSINGTVAFALESRRHFLAAEGRWVALVSTCLALLAGMGVIALVFALRLRDATFLWYAGYLASYALVQLLQTGYAASPLGWSLLADAPQLWGRHAVVVSIVMIVLFLIRFADLRTWAPRAVLPLQAYAAAVAVSAALALLPSAPLQAFSRACINPLLILGGPLLLGVAALAWRRGSRYAGFFVVGWAPLLLITVVGSLQLYGLFGGWQGSGEAALVAAAFEALVLSAGLADRTASVRRDRDAARALADADPLTGALNRRALSARLDALLDAGHGGALAVLYCDMDHFKRLNDTQGHAAGDQALRAVADALSEELRARDLLARFGGEEFVIVLPGFGASEARAVAERLCARVRDLGEHPRFGTPLTISIGAAIRTAGEPQSALLQRADAALYAAKHAGRNCVVLAPANTADLPQHTQPVALSDAR